MKLWSTGILNVVHRDDVEEIMEKIGTYLRRLRPLLDRKYFLERKQKPREKIDQFFTALQVIYDSCAYDNHALTPEELRNQQLRDQLIVRLHPAKGVRSRDGHADAGGDSANLPGTGGIQRDAGANKSGNHLHG